MRSARPGSIQATVQKVYATNGGVENVATDLGLSLSTVSYGTEQNDNRPGGLGVNYLDQLARMNPKVAEVIADHFARLSGGSFAAPERPAPALAPLQHARRLIAEGAEGQAALMALAEGGCPHEARRELVDIRDAVDAAISDIDNRPVDGFRQIGDVVRSMKRGFVT